MVAESSGAWSLEVGCRCRRSESNGYAHEPIAGTQNPRMVRTCWSEMVAAITTTNDGEHRGRMLGDEHPDGLTRSSKISSRQTRIFGKPSAVSAVSAIAAAAELVENEPSRLGQ